MANKLTRDELIESNRIKLKAIQGYEQELNDKDKELEYAESEASSLRKLNEVHRIEDAKLRTQISNLNNALSHANDVCFKRFTEINNLTVELKGKDERFNHIKRQSSAKSDIIHKLRAEVENLGNLAKKNRLKYEKLAIYKHFNFPKFVEDKCTADSLSSMIDNQQKEIEQLKATLDVYESVNISLRNELDVYRVKLTRVKTKLKAALKLINK